MGAGSNTNDSNITGLAFAEEVIGSPGTLSSPVWYPVEPNSYSSFGGQTKTVRRETINATRQKRKGVIVGLDVAAGFQLDFTTKTPYVLMKGFMFADWREKDNLVVSTTSATVYNVAAGGAAFVTTSLLYAEGFTNAANNGLKTITSATGTTVTPVGGLTAETPAGTALITRVGFQAASADVTLTVTSGVPTMGSTVLDFTTLGLIPGEWVFVGGDAANTFLATAADNGFYRIKTVAAHAVVFDRYPAGVATDAGTGKTLQVFLGHVIKNEATTALQKFRTYCMERQITPTKIQYENGCGANTLALNVATGNKITADLSYIGLTETTAVTPKAGTRNTLATEVAFNAASSFSRIRLSNDTAGTQLETFLTDIKLTIDNGITPDEAITNTVGAVDLTAGDFMVSGTVEAYFSNLTDIAAIQTNADCGLDFGMVENVTTPGIGTFATGWLFDLPLLMLGDGRLKVEKDKPVKLPVTMDGAAHATLNHTLLAMRYAYLPQLAL